MKIYLDYCVYCERKAEEIEPDELEWIDVQGYNLLLCFDCLSKFVQFDSLEEDPVILPPGITELEHTCPELLYQQQDATVFLRFERSGEFYKTECPHCKLELWSYAAD